MPAHTTALGKAMLAWVEPEQVDELVAGRLVRRTPHTVATLDALHAELHRIRGRGGLALERGENHPEIGCVAAAVRGPEGPLGAISLVGQPGTALERVAPLVVNAARTVSVELFGGLQVRRRR
jgi:DNA-binding IclR family transcriptional regulator